MRARRERRAQCIPRPAGFGESGELARNNQQVARETVDLTRQRYEAGINDSLEVVQSQEGVATADLDYITSLFAHNLAKLSLARALGRAEESLPRYLNVQ